MRQRLGILLLLLAPSFAAGQAELSAPLPVEEISENNGDSRLEVSVDYVLWWLREGRLPPTLTTSSQASQGLLGQPDTRILYGGDRLETRHGDRFNGVRPSIAYWFDDDQSLSVEANGFILERDSTYFKAVSDGSTLLARPFLDPDGNPASAVIAGDAPSGLRNGGFVGYSRIELFGEEANLDAALIRSATLRLDLLGGARFLQMRDRTDLTATGYSLPDQSTLFGLTDHYRTYNAYYGGQVGLDGKATFGRWSLNLRGEVGLGANAEKVRAFGDSTFQTPTEKIVTQTGLTVQASNTGTFDRVAPNMVSEAGVSVGYRLTRHIEVLGGYTFLLWVGALRSGDQIDSVVNLNPGTLPLRPTIPFKSDTFWAQGLNAGVKFEW